VLNIFELVQQDKQLIGIGGNNKIRLSSESGGKPENNFVHAVLISHDVGYLKFDQTARPSIVIQDLRSEMVTLRSFRFQNRDNILSVTSERSITPAIFKRRLVNGKEENRSWLLYSPLTNAAYCFCSLMLVSSSGN